MRPTVPSLLACGLLAAFPSLATAEPQASPVPGVTGAGDALVRAADDAMWLTQPADPGAIVRVTAGGGVSEYRGGVATNLPANRHPSGVTVIGQATAWPAGTLWFLLSGSGDEFGALSPAGSLGRFALADGRPTSLTAGPDGLLWMTVEGDGHGDPDAITRVNTSTAAITSFTAGLTATTDPRAITTGPDGALWFIEGSAPGRLGRITTSGQLSWQSVGGTAAALTSGPLGALWYARATTVMRLGDPTSFATTSPVTALAAGPDGALWGATTGGIARIEPGGTTTIVRSGLAGGARGLALAAGPDGRMWMTLDRSPYLVRVTVPPLVGAVAAAPDSPVSGSVTADVTANGLDTTVAAEVEQPDGSWLRAGTAGVGAGTATARVTLAVTGLAPGSSRVLRLTAVNAAGTATSARVVLTTPPPAAPPPTGPPAPPAEIPAETPVAVPVPVQGKSVVLAAASGTVRVRAPGQSAYTVLDGGAALPVGTLVDTTAGRVVLASQAGGRTQSGTFSGGRFRVGQAAGGPGTTELTLAGTLACPRGGRRRLAATAATKPRRRLWGQDSGGRYRTHGRSSVATVRGTRWLTEDTCAGTLVRVTQGAVSVKPTALGTGPTVLVHAGRSHLTPARR